MEATVQTNASSAAEMHPTKAWVKATAEATRKSTATAHVKATAMETTTMETATAGEARTGRDQEHEDQEERDRYCLFHRLPHDLQG